MKKYRRINRDKLLAHKLSYWKQQRLQVLSHYSNRSLQCKCCGERTYEFLSLDHIDGGGNQHRKKLGSKYIYSYLIHDNFPDGYQVLCHNCNLAKGFYKKCPHQRSPEEQSQASQLIQEAMDLVSQKIS